MHFLCKAWCLALRIIYLISHTSPMRLLLPHFKQVESETQKGAVICQVAEPGFEQFLWSLFSQSLPYIVIMPSQGIRNLKKFLRSQNTFHAKVRKFENSCKGKHTQLNRKFSRNKSLHINTEQKTQVLLSAFMLQHQNDMIVKKQLTSPPNYIIYLYKHLQNLTAFYWYDLIYL